MLGEALSNASRHAEAGTVEVALEAGERIVLTVSDDGQGMPDGRGRERAAQHARAGRPARRDPRDRERAGHRDPAHLVGAREHLRPAAPARDGGSERTRRSDPPTELPGQARVMSRPWAVTAQITKTSKAMTVRLHHG